MARIAGAGTKPELRLRKELWKRGLRYRVNPRLSFGRPDLALPGRKVAIFVDGCFWHGCPDHYNAPRTRSDFWAEKLRQNVLRDRRQLLAAEQSGWRVLRIWEHDIRTDPVRVAEQVLRDIERASEPSDWRVVSVSGGKSREKRQLLDLRTGAERISKQGPQPAPPSSRLQ